MKTIYIDSEFMCHAAQNPDGMLIPYETAMFYDKCDTYIEGFRCVPHGKSWTRSDGVVFHGEMITPWKDIRELDAAQSNYEREKLAEYGEYLRILGVEV